jgi:hypothetical protein
VIPRGPRDRAAIALGVASLVSAVFALIRGDLEFVTMRGGGVVVALTLGVLSIAAGWLGNRVLALVAGAAFLVAAVVLLVLLGANGNGGFLGGNASTFSLWLGLGIGLLAVTVPQPVPGSRSVSVSSRKG